jgi:Sld7 C-terminal domain
VPARVGVATSILTSPESNFYTKLTTMASWCGNLECGDRILEGKKSDHSSDWGAEILADIRLEWRQQPGIATLPLTATLRFITLVDIDRVPLCIIAGPSCDVYTESEATESWFGQQLAESDVEFRNPNTNEQSSIGLLAQVIHSPADSLRHHAITDVVFYTTPSHHSESRTPPTPPPSSPPPGHADQESTDSTLNLCLRALPIYSQLLQGLPTPPLSPSHLPLPDDAQFLPTFQDLQKEEQQSRKRKQISDVFEEASQTRKKGRKTGGQRVSAAAAKSDAVNLLIPKKPSASKTTTELPNGIKQANTCMPQPEIAGNRPNSRSSSISSETRPLSRRGLLDGQHKRSALSRVTSFVNDTNDTETRNKEAISRIVMAGMRLYGLLQRKKHNHSRRGSGVLGIERSAPPALDDKEKEEIVKDEEYKIIYHQAYKSTVCAFRHSIATEHLYQRPEVLQDVVDRLLGIFCADPLLGAG